MPTDLSAARAECDLIHLGGPLICPKCGAIAERVAAWADAVPRHVLLIIDDMMPPGVAQMRDRSGRVLAQLENVGSDLDARFGRGFSAGGAYAEGPEIPTVEDFRAARVIVDALEAQRRG